MIFSARRTRMMKRCSFDEHSEGNLDRALRLMSGAEVEFLLSHAFEDQPSRPVGK
jgi:hypothetical protein